MHIGRVLRRPHSMHIPAKKHVLLFVTALAFAHTFLPKSSRAQSYPIDCAILLCLSGGWPASVPCSRARAEFIRRITPWPVEPPLQIWRCPMRAALETPDPVARLYRLAGVNPGPAVSPAPQMEGLHLAQAVGHGADIDVSGSAFAFIRSIDVFDASLSQGVVGEATRNLSRVFSTLRRLHWWPNCC